MHQDAHEFFNFLLNRIVEEIEEEKKQAQNVNGDDCELYVIRYDYPLMSSKVSSSITTSTNSNSGTRGQDATLVHILFEGILASETRCLTCETVSLLYTIVALASLILSHRYRPATNLFWISPLTSNKIPA